MTKERVIMVGAGIGALGAAYWLAQSEYEVEVLEAPDRPGGGLRTLEHKGDKADVGAQFFHSSCVPCLQFIEAAELGSTKRAIEGSCGYRLSDGSTHEFGHELR